MKLVLWTAYACFAAAGLAVVLAMSSEAPAFLSVTLAGALTGIAFLAAHQGLILLTDIRNALSPQVSPAQSNAVGPQVAPAESASVTNGEAAVPAMRSASEIAADIAAMKARA